jgi:Ca2+-binding RTX toxin-like protein
MSTNPSRSDFRVNTFFSGEQINPDIAIGSLGNFVITWQSEDQDGDGEGVFARLYNASAVPISPDFQVNTTTQGDQINPAVAVDAGSNFVVVWSSDQQAGGFSGQDVYAQRFNSAGSPLGVEFRVNRSIQQDQFNPDVASDALGNFIVVYESEQQDANTIGQDTSGTGVFAQRFDRNGALLGAEFRVNTRTENDQSAPVVAMNSRGEFVVVWVSDRQGGSGEGVFGQRYNSSGIAIGAEFQVGTEPDDNQTNPAVAIDDSGSFVVAWQSDTDDSGNQNDDDGSGIYAQRFGVNGNPGHPILVNSTTDGDQENPAVASDASGNFTVVWSSEDERIFGQRFLPSGRRQGGEFQVNRQGDGDQTNPAVAVSSAARLVTVWQGETGNNNQQDIFGRVTVTGSTAPGRRDGDTITGTNQADRLSGFQGDDTIRGLGGNDVLDGGAGNDRLEGGNDNDNLLGGNNDDSLDGGEGNDTLTGGTGADEFILQNKRGSTVIRDFQDGVDVLGLSAGLNEKNLQLEQRGSSTVLSKNGVELAVLLGINTQQITFPADFVRASRAGRIITGTNGNDTLNGTGGSDEISGLQGTDILRGGGGDDILAGGNGNDSLLGQAGNDDLDGGNNNDTLEGGVGDDSLTAGNGNDVMIGGKGADTFFLQRKTGRTIIQDFQDGIDKFSLSLEEDLRPSQLTSQQIGADVAISFGTQELALVRNINISQINFAPSDFI